MAHKRDKPGESCCKCVLQKHNEKRGQSHCAKLLWKMAKQLSKVQDHGEAGWAFGSGRGGESFQLHLPKKGKEWPALPTFSRVSSASVTVTCFLDAFGVLPPLVNTQTALLVARIPFERKCFPNDRALPKKKKTREAERERETKAEKNGKAQKQSQVLGKRENIVNGHWSPPGGLSAEASAVGGLCDKDVCGEPGGAVYRVRFCKPHSHVNAAAM